METKDITQENIEKLKSLFPNCVTEVKDEKTGEVKHVIDFDVLKADLSNNVVDGERDRYEFTWSGKLDCIKEANKPTTNTLRPQLEKSVNFDNTRNVYIEGDNLEALKILRDVYQGKVDMIYIDPPYNTGSDLVYNDTFKTSEEDFLKAQDEVDDEGKRLVANNSTDGKYHTNWLNMMYPRLLLAKDLLSEDGFILISIDEHEYGNLKKICDDIYGETNYIENFIWVKNSTKNLSKTTSTNHEYILCYCKNKEKIEQDQIFRKEKDGLKDVKAILDECQKDGASAKDAEIKLKQYYKEHKELKGISMYDRVEERINSSGQKCLKAYRLDNISAPKSTGIAETYDVIHPITGRPCKCPTSGWRFTRSTMDENIKNGLIFFYDDELKVPQFKRFLDTVESEVIKSVIIDNKDGKKELMSLFNGKAGFDNPKPTTLLKNFIKILKPSALIMDFFAGSGSTADAMIQLNIEDKHNRSFILVQYPEICKEKSECFKIGYKSITDFSEERIRRALIKNKDNEGFRVFKIDSTNMKNVFFNPDDYKVDNLLENADTAIKSDRSSLDLLFDAMLRMNISLDASIKENKIENYTYYVVNDNDLVACFDKNINEDVITELAKLQPLNIAFRDDSFSDDQTSVNCEQILKQLSPDTKINII